MAELKKPIFVVGCAKSGTTLLGSLVTLHPAVGPKSALGNHARNPFNALLDDEQRHEIAMAMEQRAVWMKYFRYDTELYVGAELTDIKNPLDADQAAALTADLTRSFTEARFFSKQPSNTFRVHVLRELFPECKLIAIHRDGRDVVASWGRNGRWQGLGGYEKTIGLMARKWNECIDHIEACKRDLDIYTLRYEDLIADYPRTFRSLLSHCELDYVADIYDDIRLQNRTGKWVELIPAEFHSLVEELTWRNRARLGYTCSRFTVPPRRQSLLDPDPAGFSAYFRSVPKKMVACGLCGAREFTTAATRDRHDSGLCTALCNYCGLAQSNPRPVDEWYEYFYKTWFWPLYVGEKARDLRALFYLDDQPLKGRLIGERLRKEYPERHARFLDIGCGLGGLVGYMKSACPAWEIEAVEPAEEAADFVAQNFGLPVHCVPLEKISGIGTYDVISMVHVLEHSLNPGQFLRTVSGILANDGLLYIEVPDLMSRKWRGADFLHVAHNYIFDNKTLAEAVESAGMRVVKMIRSPVQAAWPWAMGAFVRKMPANFPARPVRQINGEELRRRKAWIASRIDAASASGGLRRLKDLLGPGFPGPKTWLRLYRQYRSGTPARLPG
jgi:SAM-dependent methyltransferase